MAKTATKKATNEGKKEFTLEQVFALWKEESKSGMQYFSGKYNGVQVRGFYVTKKQNPKEPDIRIYGVEGDGELSKEELLSMWCNATDSGKKYLSGKLDGKRVVGFINAKANKENKQPYISIYWSEDQEQKETKKKPELIPADNITDADIPF